MLELSYLQKKNSSESAAVKYKKLEKALKKLLHSFSLTYYLSCEGINWKTFDILSKTSLAPNQIKNKRLMQLLLWEISTLCCKKTTKIPSILTMNKYEEDPTMPDHERLNL